MVKYEENQSYNFNLHLEPKIETWDGKEITTTEKLVDWMKKIYQENMIDVITYINPLPVSQLKELKANKADMQPMSDFQDFEDRIIKISNYQNKLNLDEWVEDSIYINLPRWINDFNLFQGLIVNKII